MELEKKYRDLYKTWLINPAKANIPKAEKLKDLQKRGVKAVKKIMNDNCGKTVLLVGHGGINRAIIFHYIGLGLNSFWKIKQDNCCINKLVFKDPYPKLLLLNCTSFLDHKFAHDHNALS